MTSPTATARKIAPVASVSSSAKKANAHTIVAIEAPM
ncbi:Uncharacterised protein [Mycobacteroides abscessus subsp. abscessus]|nr:Uncharacterised protein [Mycobacteroides abscessus subsp. abscessus]